MAEMENNIIDTKVVKARKAHKGEKELWRHFNISLTGYVSGLSPQLLEMMKIAETLDNPIDPDELCEDFSVVLEHEGRSTVVDLIPNGRNIEVDNQNKYRYADLMIKWRTFSEYEQQLTAFLQARHRSSSPRTAPQRRAASRRAASLPVRSRRLRCVGTRWIDRWTDGPMAGSLAGCSLAGCCRGCTGWCPPSRCESSPRTN